MKRKVRIKNNTGFTATEYGNENIRQIRNNALVIYFNALKTSKLKIKN